MDIPQSYFGDYPLFKGKGYDTTDVRFANKYSDIYTVIMISDKIYKTDEYEHRITDTTPTGKKVKLLRRDDSGKPVKDKDGNLIYDIVDDTVLAKRQRSNKVDRVRSYIPKGDPEHRDHGAGYNFGGEEDRYTTHMFTRYVADNPDTGAHNKGDAFKPITRIKSLSYTEYNQYIQALKEKDEAFKKYDYIRQSKI